MRATLPRGYQVRRPTMDDLHAVYHVLETYDIVDFGEPDISLDDMRTLWNSDTFHLETDAWVVISPEGNIVGYADVDQREHVKVYGLVRMLPEYANRGVEDYVLEHIEAWGSAQVSLAPEHARVSLVSWVSSRSESERKIMERAGFREVRRHWRMDIKLNDVPPAPQWPDGVTARTFVKGQDDRLVFDTDEEAFKDHWGHLPAQYEEWKHWTIERENFDPTLWFLAFEGDRIAGISLCKIEGELGWVDTLAVLRPWRRKGLGLALLQHSFGEFYRRGLRRAGLGVDSQNLTGATRLYTRAGMRVAREFISFEKELRAGVELSTQEITV